MMTVTTLFFPQPIHHQAHSIFFDLKLYDVQIYT